MHRLRVIPVIDLMHGLVVRGVAGRRSEYRPIESTLCPTAEPVAVARALVERFALPELYVADLDAIAGGEPAWDVYQQLTAIGPGLLVDAGVADVPRAAALAEFHGAEFHGKSKTLSGIIVGLESLPAPEVLAEFLGAIGPERLIFSLDLKAGGPLTKIATWREWSPRAIADFVRDAGVRRMIVLDLADVGVGEGVRTLSLCRELRAAHPAAELIAGGGVRGPADLEQMAAAGCDGALVASALHDGRIANGMIRGVGRMTNDE